MVRVNLYLSELSTKDNQIIELLNSKYSVPNFIKELLYQEVKGTRAITVQVEKEVVTEPCEEFEGIEGIDSIEL